MAIIELGNSLVTPLVIPGWTVQTDGYGLETSTTTFKGDHTSSDASFLRGEPHPDSTYNYLKAHKYSVSWDSLGIATFKVDYIGIDPTNPAGAAMTVANTSSANGLTSENITSHPNFFVATAPFSATAIAGRPPTPNYVQGAANGVAPIVNGAPAYLGNNGACFEKPVGGRFIGFVDPAYPQYYGKTQYLARTTSYSGVIYTTSLAFVQALLLLLNSATATRSWGIFELLPAWAPIGQSNDGFANNLNLLSQVNVEEYGALYKIQYEIRYSATGWDKKVYLNV